MIHVSEPDLSGNEEKYVVDAIRSTWISSTGQYVSRFEKEFAEVCGAGETLSVCNGTVALHLAMLGLDVRAGDEVLVPSLTYVATANAVRYVGAEPVFVDVDRHWCIDPDKIEQSITTRTRGIIAVHLYGHPADMDRIKHIAAVHGLWVVEDAAEAHFAQYKGSPVGALGHLGTFSFYGNKILTCGEGGAVLTNDPALALRLRTLRGQGMDPQRRYYHPVTGYNFRLTNLQCAVLCAQLERGAEIIAQRNRVIHRYRDRLKDVVEFQPISEDVVATPWLMCITLQSQHNRNNVARCLADAEIETRPFFVPLHRLPPFRERSQMRQDYLPVTERLAEVGLCLPTYPKLADEHVDRICDIIIQALNR